MQNKPTMKEIARLAGVSRPTVSMILNKKPYAVTEETRKRVWRIARELNYRPNYTALSLKEGRTGCIGFVNCFSTVGDNAFYSNRVMQGIEEGLAETDSDHNLIMFASVLERTFEKSRGMIERGAVDGLVLNILSADMPRFEDEILPSLQESGIPFVVVHSTGGAFGFPNVGLNTHRGGELAAFYFIGKGVREAGVHPSIPGSPRCDEPVAGFVRTMEAHGIPVTDMTDMLARPEPGNRVNVIQKSDFVRNCPPAVFIPDDVTVYSAIEALAATGKRVPDDVALIGFDDIHTFPKSNCLTTVHHPFVEKGRAALLMLLRLLEGDTALTRELVDPWLVERETA